MNKVCSRKSVMVTMMVTKTAEIRRYGCHGNGEIQTFQFFMTKVSIIIGDTFSFLGGMLIFRWWLAGWCF
jgi:hypothetical protein